MSRFINPKTLLLVVIGIASGGSVLQADDKDDIVGRWDNQATGTNYIRFYNDGTFKEVAIIGSTDNGKYRFLSKSIIEFDTPGVFFGRNVQEVKYKLNGDSLELEFGGVLVRRYKRVN